MRFYIITEADGVTKEVEAYDLVHGKFFVDGDDLCDILDKIDELSKIADAIP